MEASKLSRWGPFVWWVLHTSAEQLGKERPPLIATDEVNRWIMLLKSVETVMPCPMCREHYRDWMKRHPIVQFRDLRGEDLRFRARLWLYKLHEEVNTSRGVDSEIPIESVRELYSNVSDFQGKINTLMDILKANVQLGKLKAEATWAFRNHLHYLRKLTDSI